MIEHLEGDCRQVLPTLPAKSVHCAVSSPPYWMQRSYLPDGHPAKQLEIGRERTVQQYIESLVGVFRQVARVLMSNGTLWLNVADKYADKDNATAAGVKPSELMGLPWRLVRAMQQEGWYARSEVVWHKSNGKPEGSITNRPTKSHEFLFLLTRGLRYFYDIDAIREPITSTGGACFGKQRHSTAGTGAQSRRLKSSAERNHPLGKNKRSVWKIPVRSYPGAHFAVFPKDLVRPCILAGCPKDGTVLDCFAGTGTVGHVAEELGRNAVLIELNPMYVEMQREREALKGLLAENKVVKQEEGDSNADSRSGWLF